MAGMSRDKGQRGERDAAALLRELTGHDVQRRVRQHAGDADLVGLPGWSIEVKFYALATPSLVAGWWRQCVEQARREGTAPLLLYRLNRQPWRAVWPAAVHGAGGRGLYNTSLEEALQSDPSTWRKMTAHLPLQRLQAFTAE